MPFAPQLSVWLLQAAVVPDTIVAKTMPASRSVFDYTSGTLQIIVLLLAVVVLGAMVYMLLALRKAITAVTATVDKVYADTRPILAQATAVAGDAREVVAMLRTDVERVTHAAGTLSSQLLNVADATERRMDDVNAVLDVVQGELEETVLSTTAALRGVRMGGRAIAGVMGKSLSQKGARRRTRDERAKRDERDERDARDRRDEPRLRDRHSRRQRDAGD